MADMADWITDNGLMPDDEQAPEYCRCGTIAVREGYCADCARRIDAEFEKLRKRRLADIKQTMPRHAD